MSRLAELLQSGLPNGPQNVTPKQPQSTALDLQVYGDRSSHRPFIPAPKATFIELYKEQWRRKRTPDLSDSGDRVGQSRPYVRLFIDKGEFGVSKYRQNLGPNPGTLFGDSAESGLSAQNKFAANFSLQWEVRRERPHWHLFSRWEHDHSFERTQQADGTYLPNYPCQQPFNRIGGAQDLAGKYAAASVVRHAALRQLEHAVDRARR